MVEGGWSQIRKVMLQARDNVDHGILWEPKGGQDGLWYDNLTQLGDMHYVLPIIHKPTK